VNRAQFEFLVSWLLVIAAIVGVWALVGWAVYQGAE
jgi:cytoskeletal protein RodZ